MDAGAALYEVEQIDKELVILRKRTKELTARKKHLVMCAINNMLATEQSQIRYGNKTFVLKEQTRFARKATTQKRKDALSVLCEEGIYGDEAEQLYSRLTKALKGEQRIEYTIHK